MATIFTVKRDDDGDWFALVLAEKSSKPTEMRGGETVSEMKEIVQSDYEDAQFVSGRVFREEQEARQVHSAEMLALLAHESEVRGYNDLSRYFAYGSALRPISPTWARLGGLAVFIQVNKQATGYHTYVLCDVAIDKVILDRYELEFVSGPVK